MAIPDQFDSMTTEEHIALKTRLLELGGGAEKLKADTLEGYARSKYCHVSVQLRWAAISDLETWAKDPLCYEQTECAKEIERRRVEEEERRTGEAQRITERRQALEANPFDPRTEVSADARKIVAHLWIIFVLLPFMFGLLFVIVYAALK